MTHTHSRTPGSKLFSTFHAVESVQVKANKHKQKRDKNENKAVIGTVTPLDDDNSFIERKLTLLFSLCFHI